MFDKILIANRGEIAVRIIRTCKRLGIRTVAVYSEADTRSLHVQEADEAVFIGGPRPRSRISTRKKLSPPPCPPVARPSTPATAFCPKTPSSPERCGRRPGLHRPAGRGHRPHGRQDRLQGTGRQGRRAGRSRPRGRAGGRGRSPGSGGRHRLSGAAQARCRRRRQGHADRRRSAEMEAALAASRQETRKAFGDSRIFMERYIEQPRHVEIQILADQHGNVVHLGERECSIQRRYQKIIEESPSPAVSDALRRQMGRAACDLARKAGYVNAGTVEFILDARAEFYFLEMNTRLQVEHPVTEMVTGLDLVELQLRVAAGEPLPFDQEGVVFNGWAMEARICAEDPERGFIPSTGMITRYAEPRGNDIRVDSGVEAGSNISVYYDSLLAKVICHGRDREEARPRLVEALNGYHIEGVVTNIDFVNSILSHPAFTEGDLSTGFIERHFESSRPKTPPDRRAFELAALAATLIYHVRTVAVQESLSPWFPASVGKKPSQASIGTRPVGEGCVGGAAGGPDAGRLWTIHVGPTPTRWKHPNSSFTAAASNSRSMDASTASGCAWSTLLFSSPSAASPGCLRSTPPRNGNCSNTCRKSRAAARQCAPLPHARAGGGYPGQKRATASFEARIWSSSNP